MTGEVVDFFFQEQDLFLHQSDLIVVEFLEFRTDLVVIYGDVLACVPIIPLGDIEDDTFVEIPDSIGCGLQDGRDICESFFRDGYIITLHTSVVALADAEFTGDVFLGEVSEFPHFSDAVT